MGGNPLQSYAPLLIYLIAALLLSAALVAVSTLIGYRRPSRVKSQPYECGISPQGDAREPILPAGDDFHLV
jgi:NADH-quinone oxidoreductase subunit A